MSKGITAFMAFVLMFQGIPMISWTYPGTNRVVEDENDRFYSLREAMVTNQISEPPDYRKPIRDEADLSAA